MHKSTVRIGLILALGAALLGACGPSASSATLTPTPLNIADISTQAVGTAFAELTLNAPTITPTPTVTATSAATNTPTATIPSPTRTPSGCANMKFVTDVTIPDGTQMPVGTAFTKTWRVTNTGTCTWTTAFQLSFSYGEAMGGQTKFLPESVAVGANYDLSVKLTVPNKTGKLTGVWTLLDDKGQPFGPLLTVVINIGSITPTATKQVTATPTLTLSPSETPTETNTPSS